MQLLGGLGLRPSVSYHLSVAGGTRVSRNWRPRSSGSKQCGVKSWAFHDQHGTLQVSKIWKGIECPWSYKPVQACSHPPCSRVSAAISRAWSGWPTLLAAQEGVMPGAIPQSY